jgi:hypothetical protein
LEIDLSRVPDIPVAPQLLGEAGFERVRQQEMATPMVQSPEQFLDALRRKRSSTLWLLSEDEYRCGLARAERYLADNPLPDEWRVGSQTLIAARKMS